MFLMHPPNKKLMGVVMYDKAMVTCWYCKRIVALWSSEDGFIYPDGTKLINSREVACKNCTALNKLRISSRMRMP